MKTHIIILSLLFSMTVSPVFGQKSPRMESSGQVDGVNISIDYGAPYVKGRTIWGGLEAYDAVWRAGANKNTTMAFDQDVLIGNQQLPAGKYGFFIIPKKEGDWVAIFNKKNDAWGAYSYNRDDDAIRVNVSPNWMEDNQEQLSFSVEEDQIVFSWEKVRLLMGIAKSQ